MNSKSNKVKTISTKEKIIYFPNKLNMITIFLIVILYGIVLFAFASVIVPRYNDNVILNYSPGEYNEGINPFILIKGEAFRDANDSSVIKNPTRLYSYVRSMNSQKNTVTKYVVSGLDANGTMKYFRESPDRSTYTADILGYQSNPITPTNNVLEKVFMKVIYKTTVNEAEVTKQYTFGEDVIHLNKKDLSKYSLINKNDDVILTFTFQDKATDETKYDTSFKIELTNKDKRHKINFQSWILTEDDQIIPFVGLYNYSYKNNFEHKQTDVLKNLNVKWVYAKVIYKDIDTGEVSELLHKISIADLTK
jgi:hypothetical protein